MRPPSTISSPRPTGAGEPLNNTARIEDFLRTQNNNLPPRQQSFHSQRRRVSFCQYHSESDLPSLVSQTPLRCPFSSLIEVQCQEQWRSPLDAAIPIPASRSSTTFVADRGPSIARSTLCPSGDSRRANGVIPTNRIAARGGSLSLLSSLVGLIPAYCRPVLPPLISEDRNVSPVMRYPPTFHDSFSGTIPRAQLGSSGYMMASATAPEEFGYELNEWSANGTEAREHARHVNNGWKGDSSAKAVLMFMSPLRLILALITVLISSKRPAFFPQSSHHLSWKATKCCHLILETGHRFLLAKSLMNSLMSQVAQVVHCRPAQHPLLLPHLSVSTSCG